MINWDDKWHLRSLSDDQVSEMVKWVSIQEIDDIISSIDPDKAPNPDGFNGFFFKHNWEIIKKDVCKAVLNYFESGKLLREVNRTFLVLIPKGTDSKSINEYMPISLCNFIYKIISKKFPDRLKKVMPDIISPNQFAFIKGRNLLDAVLLANDVLNDTMKNKEGYMYVKTDLKKAYNSIR